MITEKEIEDLTDEELDQVNLLVQEEMYARAVTIPDIQKKIQESGDNFTHKGCGGYVVRGTKVYKYESESGKTRFERELRCQRCGKEILGDPEIEVKRG